MLPPLDIWDWIAVGAVSVFALLALRRYLASRVAIIPKMARQPVGKRDFTRSQLREFDGSNPSKAILIGVKGKVYDVSPRDSFYGPGGAYHCFAGRDASRALGMSSTEPSVASDPNISDLSADELNTLNEWVHHYESKYEVVGRILEEDEQQSADSVKNK